jgi:hypothetical protein
MVTQPTITPLTVDPITNDNGRPIGFSSPRQGVAEAAENALPRSARQQAENLRGEQPAQAPAADARAVVEVDVRDPPFAEGEEGSRSIGDEQGGCEVREMGLVANDGDPAGGIEGGEGSDGVGGRGFGREDVEELGRRPARLFDEDVGRLLRPDERAHQEGIDGRD